MIPVHQIVPDVLARIVRQAPLTPEKVAFAWRAAVGPAIDRVTSVELDNRVLRVRVRDRAWRREIERAAGVIRHRLDGLLGAGVVRDIAVDVT
jgi:Dna[CI] antecedent DciA-like protein